MVDFTPILRYYARRRDRARSAVPPAAAQAMSLARLVGAAQRTAFGRAHGFRRIRGVEDFQAAVPLRRYEDLWSEWWEPEFPQLRDVTWPGKIPYFAVSSGTSTGRTKYLPLSRSLVAANRRAGLELLSNHVLNRPQSRILGGRLFMLGGSTRLQRLGRGVKGGDLSGILAAETPSWSGLLTYPTKRLLQIEDWEEKIAALVADLPRRDIRMIGGTPSWLLLLFDALARAHPQAGWGAKGLFPNLEMVVHGGVNFAPYRHRFAEWLDGTGAETREVYPASEGFIAIADAGPDDGLRLILDDRLFFEFVPLGELDGETPTRHWIGNVETGVNYAVILSSSAGFWAYVLGDTVEFVCLDPPRVKITGRISYSLSAFGEHLVDAELEAAIAAAAREIGADVTDFSVGPLFPDGDESRGRHRFVVEFAAAQPDDAVARFATALDAALCAENEDYEVHRRADFGMAAPEVRAVPPGRYAAWMKAKGKLGGQHKVPRVVGDAADLDGLLDD
ncbi:GH3 auxin-responsive promoter family protein [Marinibaculum pumilum]|uniref:GH3 auxin-responsive promoter family protein n=1 Tax=Marinibaculum pumilum TaxID=1766165 RepID=A0ABV7KVS1_9PROT